MKPRPIQLVCFAVLLCTLSLADSSALVQGVVPLQASYLGTLLLRGYQAEPGRLEQAQPALARRKTFVRNTSAVLPPAAQAVLATPWTMRPPSAQTAALQSVTGFGVRSA